MSRINKTRKNILKIMIKNLVVLSNTLSSRINDSCNGVVFRLIKQFISHRKYMQTGNCSTVSTRVNNLDNENDIQIPPALEKYLQENSAEFRDMIPDKYLKITSKIKDLYLIDHQVAKEFVSLIKDDLSENMSYVVELNPGLGFVTKELLKIGVPFIHMHEHELTFYNILSELCTQFPGQLKLSNTNLFNITDLFHLNSSSGIKNKNSFHELLTNVLHKNWKEESCMQLIGATTREVFIRHLIMCTLFHSTFMTQGRSTFYLAIPITLWNKFVSPKTKGSKNILFQVLFNYKLLGNISRAAFIPWQRKRKSKRRNANNEFDDNSLKLICVVKFEPKPELLELFNGRDNMIYFWQFIRYSCYRSTNRVIPELEKMVPGCGIKLIKKDFNIFTRFTDLSTDEIRDLFLEFRTWSEFGKTPVAAIMNDIKEDVHLKEASDNLCIDDDCKN